jgi:hypothetical protein
VTKFLVNNLKVVLSLITRDNDYQLEQAKAAEAVAQKQNVELEIFYADGNSITQSSQLLDAIHKYKSALGAILVELRGVPNSRRSVEPLSVLVSRGLCSIATPVPWRIYAGTFKCRRSPSVPTINRWGVFRRSNSQRFSRKTPLCFAFRVRQAPWLRSNGSLDLKVRSRQA